MAKTASLNLRLDSELKKTAESVFAYYGLSLPEAVTVFIKQSCNVGGLPFDLRPAKINNETMDNNILNTGKPKKRPRSEIIGLLKDKVWMADDFNEPLEEMREYME
jgi:addiction module RelB/DinJ family antitoxin